MRRAILLAGVLITAVLVASSTAYATHSWAHYHWARTSNPFTLKLGDNLTTSEWKSYLSTASSTDGQPWTYDGNDWSDSNLLNTTIVAGQASGKKPTDCNPTSGRVEVCNADYGNTDWVGVASIWITTRSHIVQGTVKVNDYYFNSSTYPYSNPEFKQHVMCQEVGHTFGLDHQSEDGTSVGTCMDYYHNPAGDTKSTTPNAHDYYQLDEKIYPHTDRTTTIGAANAASRLPARMNQIDTSKPEEWGMLVHRSSDGRYELYKRDFGGGNLVFTWVIRHVGSLAS